MFTLQIIEWINRALMGASNNVTYYSVERKSKGFFLLNCENAQFNGFNI